MAERFAIPCVPRSFHKDGIANGGNRYATVLMYLVDTEEGGETVFPNVAAKVGVFAGCRRRLPIPVMAPKRSASTSPELSASSSDIGSVSSSDGERLPGQQTTRSGRTSQPPNPQLAACFALPHGLHSIAPPPAPGREFGLL
jgi:hypothetical protein